MTFGDRLKQLREARGLSQDQLSDVLGIPRSSISHIEMSHDKQRYPRIDRIEQMADYFNVTIDYLLCRSDIKEESNVDWKVRAENAELKLSQHEAKFKLIKNIVGG